MATNSAKTSIAAGVGGGSGGDRSPAVGSVRAVKGVLKTTGNHSPLPPGSPAAAAAATGTAVADSAPAANEDYRVAVYGAASVGKSSIVLRFIRNQFSDAYTPTIEDTYQQVITCNQKICMLQITDTTGSHQFPAMQRLSIAKGHAFVLVYSISSRQSLEELGPIIQTLKEVKGDAIADVPIMLVGNKIDEDHRREVSKETGFKLADRWSCGFIETSAKTNENVTELFQRLLAMERKRQLALSSPETTDAEKTPARRKCDIM